MQADLKGHAVRGGVVTIAAQGIKFCLQLGSIVVLARLLTPDDFGLVAMVTAVTGFVAIFKDAGLSMATVQKAEIDHNQVSTLFWINVAISLGLMCLTAALAPAVAWFYHEPRLTRIALALAGAFIIGGLTIQHQALLRRQMHFGALALIEIISMLVGAVTGIVSAWYGADYWALVLMQIGTAVVSAGGVWFASGWRPGLPIRGSGIRPMLAFGGHLTGFSFVNYFSRNVDAILIGKFIGAEALGLYSKAYGLFMMPISQIRTPLYQVAMPALSSLGNQPERYAKYYQRIVDILCSLVFPISLYCMLEADFLIKTILGPQWLGAVPVFRILAVAGLFHVCTGTAGLVQLSLGFSKRYLYWGIVGACTFITAFVLGLPYGIEGVAISLAIANAAIFLPTLSFCLHKSPVTPALTLKVLAAPLTIGAIATSGAYFVGFTLSNDTIEAHLIILGVFVTIVCGLSICRESIRETLCLFLRELRIGFRKV